MTRSTKAALLSGLVFPGLGHIWLKRYGRGAILVLVALASVSIVFKAASRQAQAILDGVLSGDVAADAGTIEQMLSTTSSGSDSMSVTAATVIFGACWLIAIIDSYRVGISA